MKRSYEATLWNGNITGEVATNRGRAGEDLFCMPFIHLPTFALSVFLKAKDVVI